MLALQDFQSLSRIESSSGWKSADLPILNPAFYPRDRCARLDFAGHDQRNGSEDI